MLVVVLTTGTAVLLSSIVLNIYDSRAQKVTLLEDTELVSRVVANSSAAAVAFLDKKRAQEEINALKGVDSVKYACLYSAQMNTVLAEINPSGLTYLCDPGVGQDNVFLNNDEIVSYATISRNDVAIGGLMLVASTHELVVRRGRLIMLLVVSALISSAIAFIFTTHLQRLIYRPIIRLNKTAKEIAIHKDWNLRAEKYSNDELGELVESFNSMVHQVENDQKLLEQMAYYDPLTKLPNRRLLEERLSRAIARARRNKNRFALCFIDLDDFKWVNDTLGHDSGDILLKTLADRVSGAIRAEDTLARFGGDEFVIVLENFESEDHASSLCNKVLAKIAEPMTLGGQIHQCGASIGLAFGSHEITSMYTLMKHADIALYEAKNAGKHRYKVYRGQVANDQQASTS